MGQIGIKNFLDRVQHGASRCIVMETADSGDGFSCGYQGGYVSYYRTAFLLLLWSACSSRIPIKKYLKMQSSCWDVSITVVDAKPE